MAVRIIHKSQIKGTSRHIQNEAYETHRFLLASDQAEVTVTDITLAPDIEEVYGYDNHIEIAYCIEGDAELIDLSTQERHNITPGTLWVADKGKRFRFVASEPTRLICVFNPPFSGHETGFVSDQ